MKRAIGQAEARKMKAALKLIADGRYNDRSSDPSEWAGMIAYVGLGGRTTEGGESPRLDLVTDL